MTDLHNVLYIESYDECCCLDHGYQVARYEYTGLISLNQMIYHKAGCNMLTLHTSGLLNETCFGNCASCSRKGRIRNNGPGVGDVYIVQAGRHKVLEASKY